MYTKFTASQGVVLRKMGGRFDAAWQLAAGTVPASRGAAAVPAFSFGAILGLCLVVAALILTALLGADVLGVIALATAPVASKRPLAEILRELKTIQDEHRGKEMPQNVGEKFDALAKEAKTLQDEADREAQIKGFEKFEKYMAEVPDPVLPPAGGETKESKAAKQKEVVGYLSVGSAFVKSEQFRNYLANRMPKAGSLPMEVKDVFGGVIAVTREMVEAKAVPDVSELITPQRLAEVVRTDERRPLRMRDVLNVSQTNSTSVEYLVISGYTPAADFVAEQGLKPEAAITFDKASAPVRTLAVTMPVTEQMLQDAPQIQGIIDNEMRFDLDQVVDLNVLWGAGTGEQFLGIFNTPGIQDATALARGEAEDTLIDKVRRAMTEVRLAYLEPGAVAVHPYEWERMVLEKGTDNRYVWAVITTEQGMRIWGLRVVETVAMKNPANAQRRILVGDFQRGATLWDRQQTQVAVGWVDDQFRRNMRTVRAEMRAAFGVKRPKAFAWIEAAAAV